MVRDIKKTNESLSDEIVNLICHEFEESVRDVLLSKLDFAFKENNQKYKNLIVAGGVIANNFLRESINTWCVRNNINFLKPDKKLATDNAVMIGLAAANGINHNYLEIFIPNTDRFDELKPDGDWSLNNI